MRIGLLRNPVYVVLPPVQVDAWGQPQPGAPILATMFEPWPTPLPMGFLPSVQTYGPFWAQIRPLKGDEASVDDQLRAVVTHEVRMRWIGSIVAITPRHYLVYQGATANRVLQIASVIDVNERRHQYLLTCKEVTA